MRLTAGKIGRCAGALLALAMLGFVVINLLAYNHARATTHYQSGGQKTAKPETLTVAGKLRVLFSGVALPRPAGVLPPSALAEDCVTLTIPDADGITLGAWYCGRGDVAPLVLLFHSYGGDKTSLIGEAKAFLELGASVLLVDFRGSGASSEVYTTIGVLEGQDVAAARTRPSSLAPGTALGSLSSVALSSARATLNIPRHATQMGQKHAGPSSTFLYEATNRVSSTFFSVSQQGALFTERHGFR